VTTTAARPARATVTPLRATGLFALLTVVFTWPQARHLASVPDFKDANIFHPLPNTLALSDAILLQGVVGAPLA